MTGVRCMAAGISAQGGWLNKAAAQMKGWEVRVQERGGDGKIMWHVRVDAGTGKATRPQVEAQQRILISKLQVNTAVGSHRGCKGTVTCTNVQSHESQASALTGHAQTGWTAAAPPAAAQPMQQPALVWPAVPEDQARQPALAAVPVVLPPLALQQRLRPQTARLLQRWVQPLPPLQPPSQRVRV